MKSATLLLPGWWAAAARALSAAEWRTQSIYQLLTDRFALTDNSTTASCDVSLYCGGSWQGIINRLDYIQGMGFTAIWISPIVENIVVSSDNPDGEAYHGYWAQNLYALNSNFGTAQELINLSDALHDRGMYLMVDVVTNHMGYNGCGTCVDYSIYTPFDSEAYFHPFCLIDYDNTTSVVVCWEGDNTVSLPDVRTEDDDVRAIYADWISGLVANYSIDGLRVDSVYEVEKSFWQDGGFESASGVYNMGEVDNGDPAVVDPYLAYIDGVVNYPAYYWITQAFESSSGSMTNLVNGINQMKAAIATDTLGSFMENHDNPRFASYTSDYDLDKNAIAFTMMADGIPIIYYGQEQHFSGDGVAANREALWTSDYDTTVELYTFIASLNKMRTFVISVDGDTYIEYQANPIYSDTHTIAMRKDNVVSVYTNIGAEGSDYAVTLTAAETGFAAGESLVEVLACEAATADASSGDLAFTMGPLPRIYYPLAKLAGSGICPGVIGSGTGTSTTAVTSTTLATSTATTACTDISAAVTFTETVTTSYGETIKISGDVAALGDWATDDAVALSADAYTAADPIWDVTVSLTAGTVVEYKYINVGTDGTITWEADPNHTYTVPTTCATAASVADTWQT